MRPQRVRLYCVAQYLAHETERNRAATHRRTSPGMDHRGLHQNENVGTVLFLHYHILQLLYRDGDHASGTKVQVAGKPTVGNSHSKRARYFYMWKRLFGDLYDHEESGKEFFA